MNDRTLATSKLKSGKNIINRHERIYKRGSLMFIEGETGLEMFIVRSGKIRIFRHEGESVLELAILGAGSVFGELSLLDHQPRAATAQVLEDTVVTVIDEELFERTLEKIPSWFRDLIRLIVKRLRDTMKRTSDDIVKKSVAGVIKIILLLSKTVGKSGADGTWVSLSELKSNVFAVIGLSSIETEQVLLHLALKEMAFIRKDELQKDWLVIRNYDVLQLYMSFLRTRQRGGTFPGEQISEKTYELIDLILATGQKSGKRENQKLISVAVSQVELELDRSGKGRHIDKDCVEQLEELKLLAVIQATTSTAHGQHKHDVYVYNSELLAKAASLKQWLPSFREEILF